MQSMSEAGAVLQKQTPAVRAGKPYERPTSHSPLHGTLPTEGFRGAPPPDFPHYHRQHSASSICSVASMSALPVQGEMGHSLLPAGSAEFPMFEQPHVHGAVSPGVLRRPHFSGFTAMDGTTSYPSSATHSRTSSNIASPISQYMHLGQDDFLNAGHQLQSPNDLMQALQFAALSDTPQQQQPPRGPMLSEYRRSDPTDVDMANAVGNGLDNIFETSSHPSLASSYNDNTSAFSTGFPDGSLFSESGLVPESDDMADFLDFSGGQDQNLSQQNFFDGSPIVVSDPHVSSPPGQINGVRQFNGTLPMMSPPPVAIPHSIPQPVANAPSITTVIPAEGPMGGGTIVAVIGDHFTPDLIVLFGGRTAKLERVNPTFIQCLSPPASVAGLVEVTIQGVPRSQGLPPNYFKYNAMDSDL